MFYEFILLVIVIFFYVHINFHLNTNNELDVIKINKRIKKKELDDITALKQPTVFYFNNRINIEKLIKTSNETALVRQINKKNYVSVPFKSALVLMKNDKSYYSDNNVSLTDYHSDNTETAFLKPSMTIFQDDDIIIGEKNTQYPIKKMYHYRNFFFIASGKVKITLYAPNNIIKNEHITKDSVMMEYTLTLEKNRNYKSKTIELNGGSYLFVPAHWYVQIEFLELSYIMTHKYQTLMSALSMAPEYIKHYFKRENQVVKVI